MEAMRMRVRRSGELRAWGISLVVHVLLFLLIGASGFFLLVREQPQPSEDDVVDVTMLDDAGGGGDGGERAPSAAPASAASAEAPAVTLPPETPRGYVIVTFGGHALGFVNNLGPRANNMYPAEWRIRHAAAPENHLKPCNT